MKTTQLQAAIQQTLKNANIKHEFFIVASLSHASVDRIVNKIGDFKHIIYSSMVVPQALITPSMLTIAANRLNLFDTYSLRLIIVTGYTLDKPYSYTIANNSEYIDKFSSFSNNTNRGSIEVITISYFEFFNRGFLDFVFRPKNKDEENKLETTYFLFHNTLIIFIIALFKLHNYNITGGHLTKRNSLSPIEVNLSRFYHLFRLKTIMRSFHGEFELALSTKGQFFDAFGLNLLEGIKSTFLKDLEVLKELKIKEQEATKREEKELSESLDKYFLENTNKNLNSKSIQNNNTKELTVDDILRVVLSPEEDTELDETIKESNENNSNLKEKTKFLFSNETQKRNYHSGSRLLPKLGESGYSTIAPLSQPPLPPKLAESTKKDILNKGLINPSSSLSLLKDKEALDLVTEIENRNKNKDNSVKEFISSFVNNPKIISLLSILNNNSYSTYIKQELIEETLTDFWRKQIMSLLKKKDKLFTSKYGLSIIKKTIVSLEKDFMDLKLQGNKYFRNKNYKNLILLMDNKDIISIVISSAIPFCIKYEDLYSQSITSLYERIGKEIIKYFYINEWKRYNETYSTIRSLESKKAEVLKKIEDNNLEIDYLKSINSELNNSEFNELDKNNLNYLNNYLNKINEKLCELHNLYYYVELKEFKIKIIQKSELGASLLSLGNAKGKASLMLKGENEKGIVFDSFLSEEEFLIELKEIVEAHKIDEDDHFKIGSDLTEFIASKSKLFKLDSVKVETKRANRFILPGTELKNEILNIITIDSDLIPMVSAPEEWILEEYKKNSAFPLRLKDASKCNVGFKFKIYGGFISNKKNKYDFIRKSHKNLGLTQLNDLKLVKAINYLSSIKYKINNKVLESIFKLFEENDNRIIGIINIKIHPDTKECYNLYSKGDYAKLNDILRHNSKFQNDSAILENALLFSKWSNENDNAIYFPLFTDWRGRLFTNTGFFSYQKGELARSLILFKNGVKLNNQGLEALKIYTANCYGLDKASIIKRLEWIKDNLEKIIQIDLDFIFKADEPLLFLACCFELKGYFNDPENFQSHLPIYLDATCNGLQHLSSMINNTNLAKLVNIAQATKEDLPKDVYTFMVKKVTEELELLNKKSKEFIKLTLIEICRKFIKRAIMTVPYGATVRGIENQLKADHFKSIGLNQYILKNNLFNKEGSEFHLTNKEIGKLAKILHDVLYSSFPELLTLVTYLKQMNKFLKALSLNPIWLSPGGLIIEQSYVFTTKVELVSTFLGRKKSITIRKLIKGKINLKKQNEGIMPNLVHSFDASNIALLIKSLLNDQKNINLLTIHDCFATSANDVDLMVFQVKLAFLQLYSNNNFVDSYHNFILEYIKRSGILINLEKNYVDIGKKIKIPIKPKFEYKEEALKKNILGSQYFLN